MLVPDEFFPLVKRWEGLHKVIQKRPVVLVGPYLCPALVPTIGYGTVVPSMDHPPITEAQAEDLLASYAEKDAQRVLALCPVLACTHPARLAAILSFSYNLGSGRLKTSTLRRRINDEDWDEAARELGKWVWAGGKKLAGLVGRRADEARLILNPWG